jgi:multidrug efflux pump subunit AcrB
MKQLVVFICLLIIGLFLIHRLPVKLNPDVELRSISVSFSMQNQSAKVIEAEVTSKLEALFCRIKGVQNILSYSSSGSGSINIELSKHAKPDIVRFEIANIIRQTWNSMPQGLSYPTINMSGSGKQVNSPCLRYTVNAPLSPVQIQEYISNFIKPKIEEINGVDIVTVNGASQMIYKWLCKS